MTKIPKADPQAALKYFQTKLDCTTGPIELSRWLKEGVDSVVVVDVRRPEDYGKGHIPGAINLPREKWSDPKGLSKGKTNVLYCYSQTCHLAAAAAVELAKSGFPVMELEGGFNTWERAKLDVESGAYSKV